MTVNADLIFLPWLRRGEVGALSAPDSLGPDQPGIASATARIEVNGGDPVSVPIRLMGPGHVTALDPRQVVRTDPTRGSRAFEPNYFPLVEFDEPSLPWMFTPAGANQRARLRPWLCLVVVRKQEGVRLDRPQRGTLPVLRIGRPATAADELPDLADSWAWAHAQVTAETGASRQQLQHSLATEPERSVSRLVCGRLLQPETDYLACVVPTFELGRKAGLGMDITTQDEARLAPAWTQGPASAVVELPVYYHWDFATGTGGDFQSLALLLRARPLPPEVGRRPLDVSQSGLAASMTAGLSLSMTGALQQVNSPRPGWPDADAQAAFEAALVDVLNAPDRLPTGADPLLAPPRYGSSQSGLGPIDPSLATRWYEQLNLDPGVRTVAQFGTRVIQQHQEALMAAAWAQSSDLASVNRLLRSVQLAFLVATSLHSRHVARMTPETGLQVLAPALARMSRTAEANRPTTGLVALLQSTGLPPSAFGNALRRVARPRGAVNRRVQRVEPSATPTPKTALILRSLQPKSVMARLVRPTTQRISLERVAASLSPPRTNITWAEATADGVKSALGGPFFRFDPIMVAPHPPLPQPPLPPLPEEPVSLAAAFLDSADARLFRAVAVAHLARFNPQRATPPRPPLFTGTLVKAFSEALARTTPTETFERRVRGLITFAGPARPDHSALAETQLAPRFPQPMASALAELSQDLLLPGLGGVPPNTAVPLETNTRFVEAYLVGLNSEMARELLWRDYPATGTATFFRRFWDAACAPTEPPDITPISTWGARSLGANQGAGERFVVLVRSELLRRYPNALIYATRGSPPQERHPIFTGSLEPDVRFFGFDLSVAEMAQRSIVIQEQPSEPRFGLEVAAVTGTATHLSPAASNAAELARRIRQTPVRITIPSAALLGRG